MQTGPTFSAERGCLEWMQTGPTFSAEREYPEWSRHAARGGRQTVPWMVVMNEIRGERSGMGVGKPALTNLWGTCVAGVGNVGWLSIPDAQVVHR